MSRDEDCDVVGPIETALVTAFERDRLALLVATVACADSFIWHFYGRGLRDAENRRNAVVPSLHRRKFDVEARRDPTWQVYTALSGDPHSRRGLWGDWLGPPSLTRSRKTLVLRHRQPHHQPIHLRCHFQLARQPALRLTLNDEVQHVRLRRGRCFKLVRPGRVDIHVAGGARAGPAAIRIDPIDSLGDRRAHDGHAH